MNGILVNLLLVSTPLCYITFMHLADPYYYMFNLNFSRAKTNMTGVWDRIDLFLFCIQELFLSYRAVSNLFAQMKINPSLLLF